MDPPTAVPWEAIEPARPAWRAAGRPVVGIDAESRLCWIAAMTLGERVKTVVKGKGAALAGTDAAATKAGFGLPEAAGGGPRRRTEAGADVRSRVRGRMGRREAPTMRPRLEFPEVVRDIGVPLGDSERLLEASMVGKKGAKYNRYQSFHQ